MSLAPLSSPAAAAPALAGFASDPRELLHLPAADQVKAAAGQFEAILVRQFLQEGVGNIMGTGPAGNVYGYMLTDVLAAKLCEGGGLGLGAVLQSQLAPRPAAAAPAEEKLP